jgi:hypothetical protein
MSASLPYEAAWRPMQQCHGVDSLSQKLGISLGISPAHVDEDHVR